MLMLDAVVAADAWSRHATNWQDHAKSCATAALIAIEAGHLIDSARPADLVVLFADDDELQRLNREWRAIDKPTNVLSFPAGEDVGADAGITMPMMLGDIALAYETILREAGDQGKTLENHAAHMIVHGVLHLMGLDHVDDEEAEQMEAAERRALARLGIEDPYRYGATVPGGAADGEQ